MQIQTQIDKKQLYITANKAFLLTSAAWTNIFMPSFKTTSKHTGRLARAAFNCMINPTFTDISRKSLYLRLAAGGCMFGLAGALLTSPPNMGYADTGPYLTPYEALMNEDHIAGPESLIPSGFDIVSATMGGLPDTVLSADSQIMPLGDEELSPYPVVNDLLTNGQKRTIRAEQVTVKSGDSLERIMGKLGISRKETFEAAKVFKKVFDPRRLRPGHVLNISLFEELDSESEENKLGLEGIAIEPSKGIRYSVRRNADREFESFEEKDNFKKVVGRNEAVITTSLLNAAIESGIPRSITHQFIDLFSFSVDFKREIRKGDKFAITYEQKTTESGEAVGSGDILHAELTIRGQKLSLFRYKDSKGFTDYYDEKGRSLRKTLSNRPVGSARISSPFGMRRHPILRYKTMHWGTDFAAPRGTPIHAAGDGVIETRKYNGGYGRYIKVRHNSEYKTAYAHMYRYASGIGVGSRVKQGQVIGYVGNSGRSTGPHLHFEVIRNGKRVNPMRIKVASGRELKGSELKKFAAVRQKIVTTTAALASGQKMAALDLAAETN